MACLFVFSYHGRHFFAGYIRIGEHLASVLDFIAFRGDRFNSIPLNYFSVEGKIRRITGTISICKSFWRFSEKRACDCHLNVSISGIFSLTSFIPPKLWRVFPELYRKTGKIFYFSFRKHCEIFRIISENV